MSSFIFAIQPAIGHLNPMLSIAHQLRSEGHTVIFLCFAPKYIEKTVAVNGFPLVGIKGINTSLFPLGEFLLSLPSGFLETNNAIKLCYHRLSFFARAVGEVLDEIRPAVVVSDFAFPGACIAAESKNIPFVVIYHAGLCFKGPGIPPFGSGLPIGEKLKQKCRFYRFISNHVEHSVGRTVARTRKRLGLPPNDGSFLAWSPWLTLVLTAEAIEAPRYPLPLTTFFIGPCITGRKNLPEEDDFPFDRLSQDKPKIFISLGTFFNKRIRIFRNIINALVDSPYQLIVNAGAAFEKLHSQGLPANVMLFKNVPQLEVLTRVDVVISHGGNNTVNETLSTGKPLLVIPVGGEQGDNAARVEYLQVGLRADKKKSTPHEIRVMVRRLIEEPTFRHRAEELSNVLAQTEGPVTAARFITRIAQTRQPLHRPEGYPLTVTRKIGAPWEFGGD